MLTSLPILLGFVSDYRMFYFSSCINNFKIFSRSFSSYLSQMRSYILVGLSRSAAVARGQYEHRLMDPTKWASC